MKQYSSKSILSRKNSVPKRIAVPAFAVALLLMAGGPVFADSTPAPTPSSTQNISPLLTAVNTAQAVFNDARAKVSVSENASHASPTDDALKAALETARANAKTAMLALKAAQDAYLVEAKGNIANANNALDVAGAALKDARAKFDALRANFKADFKLALDAAVAKAKMDAGITATDSTVVATAKALVTSTYLAFNTARENVSNAEKAGHANPSDATLATALDNARVEAKKAHDAFDSAQSALKTLVGNNGEPKSNTKLDTKTIFLSTQTAFLAAHPELAAAQKAVSDAEAAFKVAQGNLNVLKDTTKAAGQHAINGANGEKDPGSTTNHMGTNLPGAGQGNFGDHGTPGSTPGNSSKDHMNPPSTNEHHKVNTPAVTAALAVFADAKAKVSAAESAFKSSPTDGTLKAALDTARVNLRTAMDDLKVAEEAQKGMPDNTGSSVNSNNTETSTATNNTETHALPSEHPGHPSTGEGHKVNTPAVTAALAVFADAKAKVSAAESAFKASPTDDTLKAALDTARANLHTAINTLQAAEKAQNGMHETLPPVPAQTSPLAPMPAPTPTN